MMVEVVADIDFFSQPPSGFLTADGVAKIPTAAFAPLAV
jgi:hypothetical protein